ncbi:transposase [Nocardiopsis dassonvillei]|uniref:transposase n=1 Tax=Nocardiopsis dassonvillei TaxID=2014 RepID=UPI000B9D66BE|nr:hypothetical protein CGQ36_11750 [Nocardiopsis dassonvillei]
MGRREYPAEFRRKVLELLEAGRSVADVARDLGISTETVYAWRCQDRIDQGLAPGLTSAEKTELAAANKRIAEVEFGAQPVPGAAQGLGPVHFVPRCFPFFAAPAACWWARTLVESILRLSSSPLSAPMRSRLAMRLRRWSAHFLPLRGLVGMGGASRAHPASESSRTSGHAIHGARAGSMPTAARRGRPAW